MARVAPQPTAFSRAPTGKISSPVENKSYLDWLHDLPCIVTGQYGVQAAHISYAAPQYGKLGRGKSRKESDRWALPVSPSQHSRQHSMGEARYWREVGIDPCIVAMALYGAYPDTDLALFIIQNIERKPSTRRHEDEGASPNE